MAYLLGIDIGTSGTKAIAIDEAGELVATASATYDLLTPRPLWAEQRPDDWWEASAACCCEVVAQVGAENIPAIGLSGQMHGLVSLDKNGYVLRDAKGGAMGAPKASASSSLITLDSKRSFPKPAIPF